LKKQRQRESGPNQIAWMEVALQILRGTRLGWDEKIGIMALISGYVRHSSLLSQDLRRGFAGAGVDKAERRLWRDGDEAMESTHQNDGTAPGGIDLPCLWCRRFTCSSPGGALILHRRE
jgi:hypothetical protein